MYSCGATAGWRECLPAGAAHRSPSTDGFCWPVLLTPACSSHLHSLYEPPGKRGLRDHASGRGEADLYLRVTIPGSESIRSGERKKQANQRITKLSRILLLWQQ